MPQTQLLKRSVVQLPQDRVLLLVAGVVFDALLLAFYEHFLFDRHAYEGIVMRSLPMQYWLVAWVMSLLPLLWLPIRFRTPSDFCVWCLYLTVIAPGPFVAMMVSHVDPFDVLCYQAVVFMSFSLLECRHLHWIKSRLRVTGTDQFIKYGIPVLLLLMTLFAISLNGFRFNLSFSAVYERRLLSSELVVGSSLESYVVAVMTKAFIPIAIATGVYLRSITHVATALLGSVAVFSFDGTKITMVLPLMLACIVWLASKRNARHGLLLLIGGHVIVAAAYLETTVVGTYVLNDFGVRRTLVTPSHLSTYYFEYFSKHSHVYLMDGLVGSLLGERRPVATASLIGHEYFGSEDCIANSGIWATAFAHGGYIAMPIVSLLAAWILSFIDRIAQVRSYVVGCGVAFVIGLVWSEKAFHTSILSGGVFFLLIVFYTFPNLEMSKELRTRSFTPLDRPR